MKYKSIFQLLFFFESGVSPFFNEFKNVGNKTLFIQNIVVNFIKNSSPIEFDQIDIFSYIIVIKNGLTPLSNIIFLRKRLHENFF